MKQLLRRTWAEIDLDALAHNYQTIARRVGEGTKVLGVVKAVRSEVWRSCSAFISSSRGQGGTWILWAEATEAMALYA